MISAKQALTWVDARNMSAFRDFSWNGSALQFRISAAAAANGLRAMLPVNATGKTLTALSRSGTPVAYSVQRIKGIDYAFFDAVSGVYAATYS